MSVSLLIEGSIEATVRSATPEHGLAWLARQCCPQSTPVQYQVGVTVAGRQDGLDKAIELMACFTGAAIQSMIEGRATTEVFDEILQFPDADSRCSLFAVFDSAQVDSRLWVRDEFDDVFEVVSQTCAKSACLDDDVLLIYRMIRRYVSDSWFSPKCEQPASAPTNIIDLKLFEWSKGFRLGLKKGRVVSVSRVSRLHQCSRRKASQYLSAIAQSNKSIANFFELPLTTVNEVLNGTPCPAQIADFCRRTGYCHPSFRKRDFERSDSEHRMIAKKMDIHALEDPVRLRLEKHREEAERTVAKADKEKSRKNKKKKRVDPEY